jgi:hypothetical protein
MAARISATRCLAAWSRAFSSAEPSGLPDWPDFHDVVRHFGWRFDCSFACCDSVVNEDRPYAVFRLGY